MYDIVVLGGGPGDLAAATAAVRAGASVALVREPNSAAESSLTRHALIRAARIAHELKSAAGFGIAGAAAAIDFRAVMARVRSLAGGSEATVALDRLKARGVEIVFGRPAFVSYDTVVLDDGTSLSASRFVIARRARPTPPPVPGLERSGHLDVESIATLETLPETLLVLGTGATAIELAQAFARLGSRVTVVGEEPRILPEEDFEVSARVRELLVAEGIDFHLGVSLTSVVERSGRIVIRFRDPANGDTFEAERLHLLVATEAKADLDGLKLEAAGVETHDGWIRVDDYLQTTSRHIAAIGDAIGPRSGGHVAEFEAALAVQNGLLHAARKIDRESLPRTAFTDPAVASVGLSEQEAREREPDARVGRLDFGRLDRARIDGRMEGFAKLIASPGGKLLGATIVGPDAGEAIQAIALAKAHGLSVHDLLRTIPPHFTYSSAIGDLAQQFEEREAGGFVRTALRWVYGFGARGGGDSERAGATAGSATGH